MEELDMRECYICGKWYEHYDLDCGDLGLCKKFMFGNYDVLNLCDGCREELTETVETRRKKWTEVEE